MNEKFIKLNDVKSFLTNIDEIEAAIKKDMVHMNIVSAKETKLKRLLMKILNMFNFRSKNITLPFTVGASFSCLLPKLLKTSNRFLYVYTRWSRFHSYIETCCESIGISVIFFSSTHVTLLFRKLNTNIRVFWISKGQIINILNNNNETC